MRSIMTSLRSIFNKYGRIWNKFWNTLLNVLSLRKHQHKYKFLFGEGCGETFILFQPILRIFGQFGEWFWGEEGKGKERKESQLFFGFLDFGSGRVSGERMKERMEPLNMERTVSASFLVWK